MRIQPIGDAVYFSAIAPGDCFFYSLQGQTTFAFAGQFDDGRKVVLVFSEGARQMPWVGYGGHPSAVFRVKDAIIRPDESFARTWRIHVHNEPFDGTHRRPSSRPSLSKFCALECR